MAQADLDDGSDGLPAGGTQINIVDLDQAG